ncbi:MAG: YdeI/OmpD-associated family protein [Cytophagaceae bacterium]|nr:YdeI/OmpD-associated family protein [Cytophagaceae bacterium]MBK9933737.1 YdeI/OmpD-associated family protein [Cytophagaceae bacterium]MBL0302548.1 YdeI/OmpD-associated family protein [Cytophagaceae bacterium]MBL0325376.1 YdeI/OmpD-associated family protein [Cytophagaceae bacterium]
MNPKVNFYFEKAGKWKAELEKLRNLVLETGLTEDLKWGCPCYTLGKANVVLIHDFKEYCALLFFKGALLQNEDGRLIQQTENVQSARQMRFVNFQEVTEREAIIKTKIFEAIEVEKAGLKVELKKTKDFEVPQEFQAVLDENSEIKTAFEALTPGRQRAYLFHFGQAKQSKTREDRIEKFIPKILEGKGLED